MKKQILSIAILALCASLFAQEYKFEDGDKNLEVQFAPLGGNPVSISGIRFRMFNDDMTAYRANAFLGYTTSSDVIQQENSDLEQEELIERQTTFTINLRPGFEKHFEGTERLSPYVGGEVDIAWQYDAVKTESQDSANNVTYQRVTGQDGFFRFGVNAVAGFDYYFSKKLYVGTELGFGLSWVNNSAVRVSSDADDFEEPDPQRQGNEFSFGPNVNGQLRLGFLF